MPEVGDVALREEALGTLEHQAVLAQDGEDRMQMLKVLGPCLVVDQYVVKENKNTPAQEGAEDLIHECLKRRWRVGEAERHYEELVMAMVSAERRLGDVVVEHPHLEVAAAQIKLVKYVAPWSSSKSSSTTGIGNMSRMVLAFNAL